MSGTRKLQRTLTRREIEVFRLLLALQTNKEIAAALGVCERTAKFHVSGILAKARRLRLIGCTDGRVALYRYFALRRLTVRGRIASRRLSDGFARLD